jgi:hypothetical protein
VVLYVWNQMVKVGGPGLRPHDNDDSTTSIGRDTHWMVQATTVSEAGCGK